VTPTATGDFDDPVARHCPSVSSVTITDCRAVFVVTSYRRIH